MSYTTKKQIIQGFKAICRKDLTDEAEHCQLINDLINCGLLQGRSLEQMKKNRTYSLRNQKFYAYAHNLDFVKAQKWADKAYDWEQETMAHCMDNSDECYSTTCSKDAFGNDTFNHQGTGDKGFKGICDSLMFKYNYRNDLLKQLKLVLQIM